MKTQVVKFYDEEYDIILIINSEVDALNYDIGDFEEMVNEMYNYGELTELQVSELNDKCDTFEAIKYTDKGGNTIEL